LKDFNKVLKKYLWINRGALWMVEHDSTLMAWHDYVNSAWILDRWIDG